LDIPVCDTVKRTLNFVFAYMIAIFDPALKHYPPDLEADH
jgi:hypothetical protein